MKYPKLSSRCIKQYGTAHRYWYQHQSEGKGRNRANHLQREVQQRLQRCLKPKLRSALSTLYLREHWSTSTITPYI